jgi:hypothetical protein
LAAKANIAMEILSSMFERPYSTACFRYIEYILLNLESFSHEIYQQYQCKTQMIQPEYLIF